MTGENNDCWPLKLVLEAERKVAAGVRWVVSVRKQKQVVEEWIGRNPVALMQHLVARQTVAFPEYENLDSEFLVKTRSDRERLRLVDLRLACWVLKVRQMRLGQDETCQGHQGSNFLIPVQFVVLLELLGIPAQGLGLMRVEER